MALESNKLSCAFINDYIYIYERNRDVFIYYHNVCC